MFIAWVIFHVIVCIALILVVLMQSSKGEGLAGSAFGGGGGGGGAMSGAVFGGRGAATFLGKATTVLAVIFMLNCGALAFMSADRTAGVNPGDITDSAVTRQAQREAQQRMQREEQQQQMAQPVDTGGLNLMQEKADESQQPAGEEPAGN